MSRQREELDSALEALQNEMRQTISKLDPKEMVWIHQPPRMPPILCKEPVVGAVPVCATASARKPVGTVTGWYGGYPVIEPVGGWMPAVGTVLYSAPDNIEAAAPDLLKALEALLDCAIHGFDMPNDNQFALNARAAIEQAHGITQTTEENT